MGGEEERRLGRRSRNAPHARRARKERVFRDARTMAAAQSQSVPRGGGPGECPPTTGALNFINCILLRCARVSRHKYNVCGVNAFWGFVSPPPAPAVSRADPEGLFDAAAGFFRIIFYDYILLLLLYVSI